MHEDWEGRFSRAAAIKQAGSSQVDYRDKQERMLEGIERHLTAMGVEHPRVNRTHSAGSGGSGSHPFGDGKNDDDNDIFGDDEGVRYYDARASVWLGVDALSEKYPSISPYSYTANNPIRFVEVDGRYFAGTNGKPVTVKVRRDGSITLSKNASGDLKRMANLITKSKSKTAMAMFKKVAENKTKVNFKIVEEKVDNNLLGLHQAHDKDGKALSWEVDSDGIGKFEGILSYITGEKGNTLYKEASITIFEGNIDDSLVIQQIYSGDSELTTEESMVETFAHEADHNINQEAIKAIKERQEVGVNNFDVEKPAYKVGDQTLKEIRKNRKNE